MKTSRIFLSVLLVLSLVFSGLGGISHSVEAASASMLISEVATGSSTSASDEYIELFNASASPVDLNGWSLKYWGGAAGGGSPTVSVSWTVSTVVPAYGLSLIHISEPTRLGMISYAVFCLKKKKTVTRKY